MRAEQFLSILQEKDLLSADLVEKLRKQVAQAKKPIPAAKVAERLVKAGHLTPALAKRLLASAVEEPPAAAVPQEEREVAPSPFREDADELELVPLDDEPLVKRPAAKKKTPAPVESEADAKPAPQEVTPPSPQPPAAAARSESLLDEELSTPEEDAAGMEPLEGLMAVTGLEEAAGPLMQRTRKRGLKELFTRKRTTGRRANQWDSSLLLVGGGTLLALLILGPVLIWALTRQSGDDAFQQAHEDYRAGSYTQAIHKYDKYLQRFPNHKDVGLARVERGLSQLWQVTQRGTRDWPAALQVAKKVLNEITKETEFNDARGDLAGRLLAIAEGLAAAARENPHTTLVEQTNETIALMEKYLLKSQQRVDKIAEIRASLALAVREIGRGEALAKAIAAMKEATAAGNTEEAYRIRKTLLKQYSRLVDNKELNQTVLAISQAQRDAVKVVPKPQPAKKSEPDSEVLSSLVLARNTTKANAPETEGHVLFVKVDGAVYGLEAATGKVLWRRFVGFDANGRSLSFPPTPISEDAGSDAILTDPIRHEVLRVEATKGRLLWRHPIGERFDAHPALLRDKIEKIDKILVATQSGRLITIDTASGDASDYVQLPQPLPVAPAVDLRRSLIFQVADHSNLFVLTLAEGRCKQVVHLGHDPGSITAPPLVVGRFLMAAVNDRLKDSLLHVFSIEEAEQGVSLKRLQQLRLEGHVDLTPLAVGRRIVVTTDLGAVSVFEISGTADEKPLKKVAGIPVAGKENLVRFPLMQGTRFWLAEGQFTRYDIQTSRGQLVPKWITDEDSAFLQPLLAIGETIFHVRRQEGVPGVLVSAVAADEPDRFWETHLGMPLVGEPIVDTSGKKLTAVTSSGALFQIDAAEAEKQVVLDRPDAALETTQLRRPVSDVARLKDGHLVLSGGEGSKRIFVLDPGHQTRFRPLALPDALGCRPIALDDGFLAPTKKGLVFLLNPENGEKLAEPFQPQSKSEQEFAWRPGAVVGNKEVVLADGGTKLYRLGVKQQPAPDLTALAEVELAEPIVSPLAVAGKTVYAVDAAGVLAAFQLPTLKRLLDAEQKLPGRCVWGPATVGDHVMLATDDGRSPRLFCLDASGNVASESALPYGPLAGTPLADGDDYILAARSGVVWRVDADGQELGKIDVRRPLGTGPVLLGQRLLLGGHDGTLYLIEPPKAP